MILREQEASLLDDLCKALVKSDENAQVRLSLIDMVMSMARDHAMKDLIQYLEALHASFSKDKKLSRVIRNLEKGGHASQIAAGYLKNQMSVASTPSAADQLFAVDHTITAEQIKSSIKKTMDKRQNPTVDYGNCVVCGDKLFQNIVYSDLVLGGPAKVSSINLYCKICNLMYQAPPVGNIKK